jgi:hypothetical protein
MDHIDPRAYVLLDKNVELSCTIIQKAIQEDWYSQRLPYIQKAKMDRFLALDDEFLKLEDKGYPFGTRTAKLDQAVTGKAIGWLFLVIPTLISAFLLIFMKNVSDTFELIAIIFSIFTPVALLFIALGHQEEKRALRKND